MPSLSFFAEPWGRGPLPLCALRFVLLMILQLFWAWLGLALLAIGIAVAFHAAFDRQAQADAERREPLDQVEAMLRSLRHQGRDEDLLRQFAAAILAVGLLSGRR